MRDVADQAGHVGVRAGHRVPGERPQTNDQRQDEGQDHDPHQIQWTPHPAWLDVDDLDRAHGSG